MRYLGVPSGRRGLVSVLVVLTLGWVSTAGFAQSSDNDDWEDLYSGESADQGSQEEDSGGPDEGAAAEEDTSASEEEPEVITLPERTPEPVARAPKRKLRGQAMDEVIVTATKRELDIRDIAGSVGAISGDRLEKIHAQGMEDYLKLVSGVTLAQGSIDDSIPIIRGIATDTTAGFTALTTGIYLDDMPFQDLFAPQSVPNLNPFDLQRVEVLKGPQGTLFGSGALAGAIRYIPNKPELGEWQAKLQLTRGWVNDGSRNETLAGAVNVPVGERAALRGMALSREVGGLYDVRVENDSGEVIRDDTDADAARQDSFRVLGSWEVSDRFSLSALHFSQDSTQRDTFAFADQRKRPLRETQPFPSPRESSFGGTNLKAEYRWDSVELLYSGNLLDKETFGTLHQESGLGIGNQNALQAPNTVAGNVDGLTNEIRLSSSPESTSRWTWLAGLSRLDYDQFIFQFFTVREAPSGQHEHPREPSDVSEAEKASSQLFATIDSRAFEDAIFGEVSRLFGERERWDLTLGLRAFRTNLKSDTLLAGGQVPLLFPGQTETRNSFDIDSQGLNPKLSLRYLFSDTMQFYALAAKGFQFGGIQLNPPSPVLVTSAESSGFSFAPYDSSKLWNFEIGMRSEWFDNRLRFDATAFYMDWTDLQLTVTVPVTPSTPLTPSVGFGIIQNVGAAHSQGVEIALDALPWPNLRYTSTASYIEAETDVPFDEDNPDGPVPPGSTLPGAADLQWSNVLALSFDLPFTRDWETTLSLTHTHLGEAPDQIRKLETVGGYDTFDLRLGVARLSEGPSPRLTLAVTNFTDKRGVASHVGTADVPAFVFVQPRTVRASLDFTF